MTRHQTRDAGLLAAGGLSAAMGLYHFFLPAQFGWGRELAHDRMLQWALLSINAFFSYLLLAGGVLTVLIARNRDGREPAARAVVVAMTGFWLVNATYQLLYPMPLPERLAMLRWVLQGFALLELALYASAMRRSGVR